jgi:hypothetical protein
MAKQTLSLPFSLDTSPTGTKKTFLLVPHPLMQVGQIACDKGRNCKPLLQD